MRRRDALREGGEPVTCWCGSTDWKQVWDDFPMHHVSTCKGCGRTVRVDLIPSKPRPKPTPPTRIVDYGDFYY